MSEIPTTPRIDTVLSSPEALTFDAYQQAAHETAAYNSLFPDEPERVLPFLLQGLFEEMTETTSSKHTYVLRILNLVDEIPEEDEANLAKEPLDMLWYVSEIATHEGLSLSDVINEQVFASRFGSIVNPDLRLDDYQFFCSQTPELGERKSKWGHVVSTQDNALLTGSKMHMELLKAYGEYSFHPLSMTPEDVSKQSALASMAWWIATVLGETLDVSLETAARGNLTKLRSRFMRGTDVLLHQSGDNR